MIKTKTTENFLKLSESLVSDSADVFLFFSDLVGSTEYKNSLILQDIPDIVWISRQLIFLKRCADIIKRYNGINVKTIGDEIFSYFEATTDPFSIIKCSVEILQSFDNIRTFKGKSKIKAKISIDFGLTYNGSIDKLIPFDPIGVPVDRCSRLNSLANENEIIFSNEFMDILKSKNHKSRIDEKFNISTLENDLKGLGKIKYYKINAQ